MEGYIDFPANLSVLMEIGGLVAAAGQQAGFSDGEIGDIQLAVDEACTNTITHGLNHDPHKRFQLGIRWETQKIEIEIHEYGAPFDPMSIKRPDINAHIQDRPIGGLGVYFIRNLMDKVEYQFQDNGLKIVKLTKYKQPAL